LLRFGKLYHVVIEGDEPVPVFGKLVDQEIAPDLTGDIKRHPAAVFPLILRINNPLRRGRKHGKTDQGEKSESKESHNLKIFAE
jgi:heat shock protein HspQ